jgi:hypothetical protein
MATVITSGYGCCQSDFVPIGSTRRVRKDEPLFGLGCQESVQDQGSLCSGFDDSLFG